MNVNILISLIIFSSCTSIMYRVDKNLQQEKVEYILPNVKTYCPQEESLIQILSENPKNHPNFKRFLSDSSIYKNIGFIDKIVLLSLIQMNLRPDLSSTYSRVQFSINYKKQYFYLNYFSSTSDDMTYLYALEDLLNKFKSKNSLLKLAKLIDQNYPNQLYISNDFAKFLSKNKEHIYKSHLKKFYYRGDETLKTDERVTKLNFTNLIRIFNKNKKSIKVETSDYLFNYKVSPKLYANCNYDMGLYKDNVFLISPHKIKSNIFGLKEGSNAFIASSTQNLKTLSNKKISLFFQGVLDSRPAAFCSIKSKINNNTIWLFSTQQRDPGQHIYHIFEYGTKTVKNLTSFNTIIKSSRYLFLQNPTRLMFESSRSSNEKLEDLLKMNIPIYHAKDLGKVWSYFESSNHKSFIIDDRKAAGLSCLKR